MEFRHLQAFLAVAEELHFGRAARRLHVAQPPLSQTIRALERELGAELFVRTTRSVQLTAAGEALLVPARIIEAQMAVARSVARAAGAGETGRVSIGFGGASGYAVLSALTRVLAEAHPGIELDLRPQRYTGQVLDELRGSELDMGIVGLPVPEEFATQVVRTESLMVALPGDHRLAAADAVDPADLAGERFVVYPAEHGSFVRDAAFALCAGAGFAPRSTIDAPDPYSLLAMVGAGVGVAVVVESTGQLAMSGVIYKPLAVETPRLSIALAWLESNPSPTVHTVVRAAQAPDPRVRGGARFQR